MADDGAQQAASVWPSPKFHFQVEWGGQTLSFQEVSGLDVETQVIEYRGAHAAAFSPIKMPGMRKTGKVTLKKGVFKGDHRFWDWFNQIKMNTFQRVPVTIRLLDEAGQPAMVWTLANAWPTKVGATDLKAEGNEVVVETLELAHEGLTIAPG